jgi:DNA-binding IclR family transcriptional regulator
LDRGASARILVAFTDGKGAIYDRVRDTGLYVSKGERDADTAAIAVPVFGRGRAFVGALGVTGPISRFDDKRIRTMSAVLSSAAQKLSKTIGGG